jgi:hypothetical protein
LARNCLLIFEAESLFETVMLSVLGSGDAFSAIRSEAHSLLELGDEIKHKDIRVVIIDSACHLSQKAALVQLLTYHPVLKIVIVHQGTNRLQVIQKSEIVMGKAADLLTAIQEA